MLAQRFMSSGAVHLIERGYAVIEAVVDDAAITALRASIAGLAAAHAPTALWSAESRPLGDDAIVTPTGLALPRLLRARPELAPLALPEALRALMRDTLGAGARVELVGAVITDRQRPFFGWHTHIDGLEEGTRRKARAWPAVPDVRRVLTLMYLDDVDDDGGPLLVSPRRAGDPCEPPADPDAIDWPGQIELRPRAGTLVALDQCTWHAARAMTRDGTRTLVGVYFAAAHAAPAPWADVDLGSVGST